MSPCKGGRERIERPSALLKAGSTCCIVARQRVPRRPSRELEMPSYPTAYRGGRSLQRGRTLQPPNEPPLGLGPYMALGALAWAFGNLAYQMQGWAPYGAGNGSQGMANQSPAAYGWSQVLFYRPGGHSKVPAPINCNAVTNGQASWEAAGNNPLNPAVTQLNLWNPYATFNAALLQYNNCIPHSRWLRNAPTGRLFARRTPVSLNPVGVPVRLPVLWARALEIFGLRDRGYAARGEIVLTIPGQQRPPLGVDVIYPPGVIPQPTVRYSDTTETVVRARAVPASMTREIKMQPNTAAGRMWMGVYASLNFLGAAWGLTRALHRAIPRANRRKSKRLGSMLQDIYNYAGVLNTLTQRERDAYLMASGAYMAMWTANRWAYGKAGAGLFTTQSMGAGGEALARSWATFDSAARSSQYRLRQTVDRQQTDARW